MIQFTTTILQFGKQGEKTGWSYILIPAALAQEMKPGNKKSFRVKGKLDHFPIAKTALLPMGGGDFILPLNAGIRKGIRKNKGAMLKVSLQPDHAELSISADLLTCLSDEPAALKQFEKMPRSHQHYYSKWIESAKTEPTRAKRIAMTVTAMIRGMDYGTMLREARREKE